MAKPSSSKQTLPRQHPRRRKVSALAQRQFNAYLIARETLRRLQRAPPDGLVHHGLVDGHRRIDPAAP